MSVIKNKDVLLDEGQTLVIKANGSDFRVSYEEACLIVLMHVINQGRPPGPGLESKQRPEPQRSDPRPSDLVSRNSRLVPSAEKEVFLEEGQTLAVRAQGTDFRMDYADISYTVLMRIVDEARPPRPASEARAGLRSGINFRSRPYGGSRPLVLVPKS